MLLQSILEFMFGNKSLCGGAIGTVSVDMLFEMSVLATENRDEGDLGEKYGKPFRQCRLNFGEFCRLM